MNTKKPVIALTPYYNTEKDEPYMRPAYLKALHAVGAIPVILPLDLTTEDMEQLIDSFDGILFTGGPDIHPFFFGEDTQAQCGNVCLKRDNMEFALLEIAMGHQKPILGICRGAQMLNIALGGDIYQDIPSQFPQDFPVAHVQPFIYEIPSHKVEVMPGTLLAAITQAPSINVNSMHHQAVRNVAPGLIASGFAAGELIECIEKPDYPFLIGVQWHPEYLWDQDPAMERLFQMFVDAARK